MLCLIIHILFFAEISERFIFTKLVFFICIIFWEFRLNNKLKINSDVWDIPLKVNIPFILENYTTFLFC